MSKVNIKLDQRDLNQIEYIKNHSQVHAFLRNRHRTNFNVGDVLVRYQVDYDGKTRIETVSRSSNAPKKFVVVYVDDFGLPYVKHLKVNGEFTEGVHSVCDMALDRSWYEADPEYAERILLGDDTKFDPIAQFNADKEQRKMLKDANRKIREKTNTRDEVRELIEKIHVGNKIWFSGERDICINVDEMTVQKIEELTMMEIKKLGNVRNLYRAESELDTFKQTYPKGPSKFYVLQLVDANGSQQYVTEYNFWRRNIFLTKPQSVRMDK